MRALIVSAVIFSGIAAAGLAQAQPYGHHRGLGGYAYRYDPPRAYGPDGRYTPYSYPNGYDGYNGPGGLAGALLGAALDPVSDNVPHDEYGPDPNGLVGPDGRRIKCRLTSRYDSGHGRYVIRRECW